MYFKGKSPLILCNLVLNTVINLTIQEVAKLFICFLTFSIPDKWALKENCVRFQRHIKLLSRNMA